MKNNYTNSFFSFSRFESRSVSIGGIEMGSKHPIRIQSMLNTTTSDIQASVNQCIELYNAGCEYIRITVPTLKDVDNFKKIKNELIKRSYNIPLIADVHFKSEVAEEVAKYASKVRINPGNYYDKKTNNFEIINYSDEINNIAKRLKPLIDICKQYGTAIRIGSNHGSLSDRILMKYGNTPLGMVEAAMEFIHIFVKEDFHQLVISMKSSNPIFMVESTRLLILKMKEYNYDYPIHLGVTEAGDDNEGIIRSSVGIGCLLEDGIGDTIRVSLTGNPIKEIPVALKIAKLFNERSQENNNKRFTYDNKVSSVKLIGNNPKYADIILTESDISLRTLDLENINKSKVCFINLSDKEFIIDNFNLINVDVKYIISDLNINIYSFREFINEIRINSIQNEFYIDANVFKDEITSSSFFGSVLIDRQISGIYFTEDNIEFVLLLLQVLKIRITSTEFISCPTCGRTKFDLSDLLKEAKERLSHLVGLKIAMMGCIVNGPGEMSGSDYGCVGAGKNLVHIYKKDNLLFKNISINNAIDVLISLIKENNEWVDPKEK